MLVHCQNQEEAKAVLCMLADSVGARLRAQGGIAATSPISTRWMTMPFSPWA